jgi:hypothetical protein
MNRKERAPGTGNPDEPIAHPERDPQTDEDIADVRAALEALAEIEAGAGLVPADRVWAELIPGLAGGGEQEPGAR